MKNTLIRWVIAHEPLELFIRAAKDFQEFVKDEHSNLVKSSFEDDYKTFVDQNEEELDNTPLLEYHFLLNIF